MLSFRLLYSETSGRQIKSLHPGLKPLIKKHIEDLKEKPFLGKPLERELSGYYSLRTKKFRIIYDVDQEKHIIRIHYLGPRKDIYELFRQWLAANRR
ncbi:MAG: type II toxin-antitoxin system RelE/ParE family toxin [Deltaproteobacteria bacterium]|nr:type II toxin-antitoxin system RelE/ParE family toxin [Deltaproteobacteria bacterium]